MTCTYRTYLRLPRLLYESRKKWNIELYPNRSLRALKIIQSPILELSVIKLSDSL